MKQLAKIALALPDVGQGVACAGTPIESRTFTVRNRAFLFVSAKDVRLKLAASAAAATARGIAVGAHGWIKLPLDGLPPVRILSAWIAESYALCAGTTGVSATPKARRSPAAAKPKRKARAAPKAEPTRSAKKTAR